jgi:hypothetical protein
MAQSSSHCKKVSWTEQRCWYPISIEGGSKWEGVIPLSRLRIFVTPHDSYLADV